jgi:starch-binding outer membrane protein, SusD/RagB family
VNNTAVNIFFRPNYYLSGLGTSALSSNPWLLQTVGWLGYSGEAGTFDYQQ